MQNFRTVTIPLHQAVVERAEAFPRHRTGRAGPWASEYRVVDVTVADGRRYEGLLLVRDDMLLLPESEEPFESEEITDLAPTPVERIPDFTITDPDVLWQRSTIEWGNSIRGRLFGPERPEKDWRAAPLGEAHDEALDDDVLIDTYDGEIPACYHGPRLVALTPEGIRLRCVTARTEEGVDLTFRPRTAAVWRDLLEQEFLLDATFTFGDLLRLLVLPAGVGREVYLRSVAGREADFTPWTRALEVREPEPTADIEYLEVSVHADWALLDDRYDVFFDATGRSSLHETDDPEGLARAGERTAWSLWGIRPSKLLHMPIRIDDTLVFPVPHDQTMAFLRGPLRAWRRGGEEGPEPEAPVAFGGRYRVTLADLLRALFRNIGREPDVG